MSIYILTLFPEMFEGPFAHSMLKIAQKKNLVTIHLVNIRDFGIGKHQIVDDKPYGGGSGMVMRVDVLDRAIKYTLNNLPKRTRKKIILLDARGKPFTQRVAKELSTQDVLILVAGHYEGVDERVTKLVDDCLSIGDYVLTGGEIPAMVVTDAVVRLIPRVLKTEVTQKESFSLPSNKTLLEHPHYTRPRIYKNMNVPKVLLSGDHARTKMWKEQMTIKKTKKVRPDLLK